MMSSQASPCTAGLILVAGQSSRFGGMKQLALVGGEPLLPLLSTGRFLYWDSAPERLSRNWAMNFRIRLYRRGRSRPAMIAIARPDAAFRDQPDRRYRIIGFDNGNPSVIYSVSSIRGARIRT
jgi:hypothetical protein